VPKRIRPARHYQRPDSPVLKLILQNKRPIARDLRAAFMHLGELVPAAPITRLIRSGRFREIPDAINFKHYNEILKKPFARIADAYQSAADHGVRKINGSFAQARQRVRFRKAGIVVGAMLAAIAVDIAKAADVFNFDMFNQSVQDTLRQAQDDLIQQLEQSARDAIETIVLDGATQGLGAADIVDNIRELIGLTDTQAQAVLNFRDMLENLDSGALTRQLRNTQFDAAVQDAIDNNTDLGTAAVDQMVSDYTENYLDYRAATIAQTESVRSVNQGLHDAYSQAIDRGVIPDSAVKRQWQLGDSPCPVCESIPDNNPDGVGVDEDFNSDDGPISDPPVHPNCMCEVDYVTDISQVPEDTADESGSYDTANAQAEEYP
jgi:hypothetical protein